MSQEPNESAGVSAPAPMDELREIAKQLASVYWAVPASESTHRMRVRLIIERLKTLAREQAAAPASVPPEGIAARIDTIRQSLIDSGCERDDGHCSEQCDDFFDYCLPCQAGWLLNHAAALSSQLEAAQQARDEALARAEQAEAKAPK